MKPTIEVIVSPTGDITINAIGFKGADCERATKAMEEALGTVKNRTRKPEYHANVAASARQNLGGG